VAIAIERKPHAQTNPIHCRATRRNLLTGICGMGSRLVFKNGNIVGDSMADNPIWKRLPSDTDKSFEAFCIYRDMGATRSLKMVAEKLSKSDTIINRWSREHNWVNRVAAYDASLDEKNLDKNAERQEKIKDNAYSDYEFLRKSIENFKTNFERVSFVGINAYEVGNLVELMKKADDYARRAVGLPDKITEQKNEVSGTLNVNTRKLPALPDDTLADILDHAGDSD
jgi:hypothetical protein